MPIVLSFGHGIRERYRKDREERGPELIKEKKACLKTCFFIEPKILKSAYWPEELKNHRKHTKAIVPAIARESPKKETTFAAPADGASVGTGSAAELAVLFSTGGGATTVAFLINIMLASWALVARKGKGLSFFHLLSSRRGHKGS